MDDMQKDAPRKFDPGLSFYRVVSWTLFSAGLAYLLFKVWQISGSPGYDFRFIWVAGKMWINGVSPYSPEYLELARSLVTEGNIPNLWVYPPNWWMLAAGFAVFDLKTSAVLWNVFNIALTIAAGILLVRTFRRFAGRFATGRRGVDDLLNAGPALFCVHFFLICVFEPTALVLSVGQTSLLIYFGIALLVFGLAASSGWLSALGLAILFLKPQMGLIFIVPLLVSGKKQRTVIARAVLISALLCIPAFIAEPAVLQEFLVNLREYDGFTRANDPLSMTGVRIIVFEILGRDIGNIAATAATLLVVAGASLYFSRKLPEDRRDSVLIPATVAVVAALAPLHTYDLVIVGVLPFVFLIRPFGIPAVIGTIGAIALSRPENWALLSGFHGDGVGIFPGSRIATIGSVILALAVLLVLAEETREHELASESAVVHGLNRYERDHQKVDEDVYNERDEDVAHDVPDLQLHADAHNGSDDEEKEGLDQVRYGLAVSERKRRFRDHRGFGSGAQAHGHLFDRRYHTRCEDGVFAAGRRDREVDDRSRGVRIDWIRVDGSARRHTSADSRREAGVDHYSHDPGIERVLKHYSRYIA